MQQQKDRKSSPREASNTGSGGAKGGNRAKLKENIPKCTSPVASRKYGAHSGIKFKAPLKEALVKPVSFDARPKTDKVNPNFDVSPGKLDDEKSEPDAKEVVERLQLLKEGADGPRTRSASREILAAAPPSKIPRESRSNVLSSKDIKPSNILEPSSSSVGRPAASITPPRKQYGAHSGMKFHAKPKKQAVVKQFILGKKSSDMNRNAASAEEQQREKSEDEMKYVPKKITQRRNAID